MEFDLTKRHCYYFNEIAKIPHGSYNEKALSDHLVDFAKDHGLEHIQDPMGNVVIYKEGTGKDKDHEPLILQAHMDMVAEKNKDSAHDFLKDPLELYVEDGFLKAKGTTLGADDGTGVAYMLAILDDDSLVHPPLECCFTVQEEVGLLGSQVLKAEYFKGKRMISLDGGGEVKTGISAAGGCIFTADRPYTKEPVDGSGYILKIRGLSGGHSGGEIHKEKGNANTLAVRMLEELADKTLRLVSIDGGLKDNAIPRECDVVFTSTLSEIELKGSLDKSAKAITEELEYSDPGFFYELEKTEVEMTMSKADTEAILDFIYLAPNGFRHRSIAIEGLTLTSLNMGVIKTDETRLEITISIRSALESGIDNLVNILKKLALTFGLTYSTSARYPGWNYVKESKMREIFREVLKKTTGQDLIEEAAHGGNECGVFNGLLGGVDIITMGPKTYDIHTPKERLDLASFDRAYTLLTKVVEEC